METAIAEINGKQVKIVNTFHGTERVVRPEWRHHDRYQIVGYLSAAQVRAAGKALCGMSDCACGGLSGAVSMLQDGSAYIGAGKY